VWKRNKEGKIHRKRAKNLKKRVLMAAAAPRRRPPYLRRREKKIEREERV